MMRELANDEAAYRSLTLSWFRHSPTYELLRRASELGFTLVLTTDHGTTRVKNAVQIIADKNTNTNIRYKVGKALNCASKNVFSIEQPKRVGLPCPNVSSSYAFCIPAAISSPIQTSSIIMRSTIGTRSSTVVFRSKK